jgi:hypothetical protein
MSKIVQAVNSMIAHSELISDVMQGDDEYFFVYKNKYKWSMAQRDSEIFLWYYPGSESLQQLSQAEAIGDWEDINMVKYTDKEIGTKEATASFQELFLIVKEKVFRVDEVLDDIISDDDDF